MLLAADGGLGLVPSIPSDCVGIGHSDWSGTGLDRELGSSGASGVTRSLEDRRPGHEVDPVRVYGAGTGVAPVTEARCSTPRSSGQGRVMFNSEGIQCLQVAQ